MLPKLKKDQFYLYELTKLYTSGIELFVETKNNNEQIVSFEKDLPFSTLEKNSSYFLIFDNEIFVDDLLKDKEFIDFLEKYEQVRLKENESQVIEIIGFDNKNIIDFLSLLLKLI